MTNRELKIILRLKDEASKRLKGIRGTLQRFANSWKKNWLAITAGITASIMAIRKAFDVAELGAKAQQIEQSFARMASSVGQNAEEMKKAILTASGATVNFSNVAANASALMAQGLNLKEISDLMRQARAEAKLFGTTTEQAFQNITSAITGGLVTTLRRSYGLQLSLKEAMESYAKSTGKTSDEVKKFYQAQAIANHILDKSKTHLEAVNLEILSNYEKVQKVKAMWLQTWETIGASLFNVVEAIKGAFQTLTIGILKKIETMIRKLRAIPFLSKQMKAELDFLAEGFSLQADEVAKSALESWELAFKTAEDTAKNAGDIISNQMKAAGESASTSIERATAGIKESLKSNLGESSYIFSNFTNNIATQWNSLLSSMSASMGGSGSGFSWQGLLTSIVTGVIGGAVGQFGSMALQYGTSYAQYGGTRVSYPGGTGTASGNATSVTPAVSGSYATGTEYVPRTGLYQLHRGEKVVPAAKVKEQGRGGNIIIQMMVKAWDASDIQRNKKTLANAVAQEIKNNGTIRKVLKQYG